MSVNPQDPSNPNNQNPNQPNLPPVDLNKLLNFDEMRTNIEKFFNEMLEQLGPTVKSSLSGVEKQVHNMFDDMKKQGTNAIDAIGQAATQKDPLKQIGISGKKAADAMKVSMGGAIDELAAQARRMLTPGDLKDIEEHVASTITKLDNLQAKADKKNYENTMKYLKVILSKEEFAVQEIIHEREELLKILDEEYKKKHETAEEEVTNEKDLQKLKLQLDEERDRKKKHLREKFSDKERDARGETGIAGKVLGMFAPDAVAKGAKADMMGALLKTAEKFSSVAFILGGVAAVFMKLLGAAQEQMIRQARQTQLSFNVSGNFGNQAAQKAFNNVNPLLTSLGFKQDEIQKYIETLGEAPEALKAAATGEGMDAIAKLTDRLGAMGVTADKTMERIAQANLDWGMSTNDLIKIQEQSTAIQRITGLRASDAMNAFFNLNAQIRGISTSTRDASTIMVLANNKFLKSAAGFSQAESSQFQGKLASAIGALQPSDIAGMFQFTRGKMPKGSDFTDLEGSKGGTTQLLFDTLLKEMKQGGFLNATNGMEQIGIEQVAKQNKLGLSGRELTGLLATLKKYDTEKDKAGFADKYIKANTSAAEDLQKQEEQGRQLLQDNVDISSKLEAALDSLVSAITSNSGLTAGIWQLSRLLSKMTFGGMDTRMTSGISEKEAMQMEHNRGSRLRKNNKNITMKAYKPAQPVASYDPETDRVKESGNASTFTHTNYQL